MELQASLPMPTFVLPQVLHLRRTVKEMESWLEGMEVELRVPIRDQNQAGLEELLGTQGELEAAVDRQAKQAQALLGQARDFVREGHCHAHNVEEQAQRLLQR